MFRETTRDLVKKAYTQCENEAFGSLLPLYENDELDEMGRAVFAEHLTECRHCMALFIIDSKQNVGYLGIILAEFQNIKTALAGLLSPKRPGIGVPLSIYTTSYGLVMPSVQVVSSVTLLAFFSFAIWLVIQPMSNIQPNSNLTVPKMDTTTINNPLKYEAIKSWSFISLSSPIIDVNDNESLVEILEVSGKGNPYSDIVDIECESNEKLVLPCRKNEKALLISHL